MLKISGWSLIRLYTILVYVFMFAPIIVVVVLSFNPEQFGSFPMKGFSFRWFVRLAQNQTILIAFKNSLILGALTAVVSTAVGIMASMAFVRYNFPGKNTLNTLLLAPIMIPEVILGVALLLPLTFGFGENAALRSPLAWAVIGGLVTSTLLTLVVIPCIYMLFGQMELRWFKHGIQEEAA